MIQLNRQIKINRKGAKSAKETQKNILLFLCVLCVFAVKFFVSLFLGNSIGVDEGVKEWNY